MPTQEEIDRVLAAWLCNECYRRVFIAGFKHGVTSETKVNAKNVTKISLKIDGGQFVVDDFVARTFSKNSYWKFEFFDPHGVAPNGTIDTQYVSYWGNIANNCWGETINGRYQGSYNFTNRYANGEIYFADLRNDLVVYYHESGTSSGSASGNAAMGSGLAYAEFDGSDKAACKGVNTLDAIKMPMQLSRSITKKEIISKSNTTVFSVDNSSSTPLNVAASDRSGYSGGVAYDTYAWGSYARIDTTKPYDCKEGVYVEDASPEMLEYYRTSWEVSGSYTEMDNHDWSIWVGNYDRGYVGSEYVGTIPDGTYNYPDFVRINALPRGSWSFDASDNTFFSMVTFDYNAYNALNGADPAGVAKMPAGSGKLTWYGISPL